MSNFAFKRLLAIRTGGASGWVLSDALIFHHTADFEAFFEKICVRIRRQFYSMSEIKLGQTEKKLQESFGTLRLPSCQGHGKVGASFSAAN